jgi:hypothetical protein
MEKTLTNALLLAVEPEVVVVAVVDAVVAMLSLGAAAHREPTKKNRDCFWYGLALECGTCRCWNTGAMGRLMENHNVKGLSSGPNANLSVQDQINATIAQAPLAQVNLATQASEGVDDPDPDPE